MAERLRYLRERPLYYQIAIGLLLVVDVIFIGIFFVMPPSFLGAGVGLDSQLGRLSFMTLAVGGIAIAMPLILLRALGNELRAKRFAAQMTCPSITALWTKVAMELYFSMVIRDASICCSPLRKAGYTNLGRIVMIPVRGEDVRRITTDLFM